jgi:hypothetical protein
MEEPVPHDAQRGLGIAFGANMKLYSQQVT